MQILKGFPADILQKVVMEVDGVETAAEVPEGLGADGLDAGRREINFSELSQGGKLNGGQARDVILAQDYFL